MPTATETETQTVTFNSRGEDQTLTRRPPRPEIDEFGQKTFVTEQEWFDRMRQRQQDTGETFDDTPWKVQFENHVFKTEHPKLIRWLRQHDKLGVNAPGGFWEVPPTEDELRPTRFEQFQAIEAAKSADDPTNALLDIRDNERDTHNRPAVIEAAEAAISMLPEEPSESEAAAGSTGDPPSTSQPTE